MRHAELRRLRYFCGAGIALAFVLGLALQAQARGLVADQYDGGVSLGFDGTKPACLIGQTECTLTDLKVHQYDVSVCCNQIQPASPFTVGVFGDIYIYSDGIITIGGPLLSGSPDAGIGSVVVGNGGTFIAPAFFNHDAPDPYFPNTTLGGGVSVDLIPRPPFSADTSDPNVQVTPDELRIQWTFDTFTDTNGRSGGIFGIDFFADPNGINGKYDIAFDYGLKNFHGLFYCDPAVIIGCDGVGGVALPNGATVGASYNGDVVTTIDSHPPNVIGCYQANTVLPAAIDTPFGTESPFLFNGYEFPATCTPVTVPEPSTWSIVAFCLGGVGVVTIRRRRRRDGMPVS